MYNKSKSFWLKFCCKCEPVCKRKCEISRRKLRRDDKSQRPSSLRICNLLVFQLITKAPPLEEEVDSELALKTEEFYSREYLLLAGY